MIKNILISAVFIVSLIACSKDKEDAKKDSKIIFKGITMMDEMGNSLSNPDTTDWRFDDKWTTEEEDLFAVKNANSNQKCLTTIILYPNPFQDVFRINLNNFPNSSRMSVRLVNKDFKVLLKNDSIYGSIYFWPSDVSSYDTLRLYYKLTDPLNFEHRGHGDILIKK